MKETSDGGTSSSKQPKIAEALKDVILIAQNSNRWIQLTKSVATSLGKTCSLMTP